MTVTIAKYAAFSALFLIGCGGETVLSTGSSATDGGTHQDSGTPVSPCINTCIDGELSWGQNGGFTDSSAVSNLSSCSAYSHQESSSSSGDLSCTDAMSQDCNASGITAGDVAGAFESADVQAAFAGSTQVYGSDPRGCDGELLQITYQGKSIDVGGDCSSGICGPSSKCVDVPSGLGALADLLIDLDKQELQTKDCASVFPGG